MQNTCKMILLIFTIPTLGPTLVDIVNIRENLSTSVTCRTKFLCKVCQTNHSSTSGQGSTFIKYFCSYELLSSGLFSSQMIEIQLSLTVVSCFSVAANKFTVYEFTEESSRSNNSDNNDDK